MPTTYLPKHHAVLYSSIVKSVLEIMGSQAIDDIKEMTRAYGRDRAVRMAKRAIHDGLELNALSYLSYGELDVPAGLVVRTSDLDGDSAVQTTTKCAWHDAWEGAGHLEFGKIFCEVFDEALAEGFHKDVNMKVPVTITTGDKHCKFVFENSKFTEQDRVTLAKRNEKLQKSATKPFIYHMGHLYSFMSKELENRYQAMSKEIMKNAMKIYAEHYDHSVVEDILKMQDVDYSSISDYKSNLS